MRALLAISLLLPLILLLLLDNTDYLSEPDRDTTDAIRRITETSGERQQIAADLLNERITLSEAASGFHELSDRMPPNYLEGIQCQFMVAGRDELHFRHVLCYVTLQATDEAQKSVIDGLRQEMQERERENLWR